MHNTAAGFKMIYLNMICKQVWCSRSSPSAAFMQLPRETLSHGALQPESLSPLLNEGVPRGPRGLWTCTHEYDLVQFVSQEWVVCLWLVKLFICPENKHVMYFVKPWYTCICSNGRICKITQGREEVVMFIIFPHCSNLAACWALRGSVV